MATAKQIAANRRNAQKSTGPRTEAGKEIVSHNRLVHGLCAQFDIIPGYESQEQFDRLVTELIADEQPVGRHETELVIRMAEALWVSKRALRIQNSCFMPQPRTPEHIKNNQAQFNIAPDLERWVRYQTAHDRAYQRAATALAKHKKERRLAEIGFESQKRAQAAEIRKQAAETRKAEEHAVTLATKNIRKQREELKFGSEIAGILPPNFDISSLNPVLTAALNNATPPDSAGK